MVAFGFKDGQVRSSRVLPFAISFWRDSATPVAAATAFLNSVSVWPSVTSMSKVWSLCLIFISNF